MLQRYHNEPLVAFFFIRMFEGEKARRFQKQYYNEDPVRVNESIFIVGFCFSEIFIAYLRNANKMSLNAWG